jgi:hypothetical protein
MPLAPFDMLRRSVDGVAVLRRLGGTGVELGFEGTLYSLQAVERAARDLGSAGV